MQVVMEGRALLKLLKAVAGVANRGMFAGQVGLAKLSLPEGRPILLAEAWDGVLGVRTWADVAFPRLRGPAPKEVEVEPQAFFWDAGHSLIRSSSRPSKPIEAEPGSVIVPVGRLAGLLAGFDDRWVQLTGLPNGGVQVRILPTLGDDGKPERDRGGQWRLSGPQAWAWPAILYENRETPAVLPPAAIVRLGQAVDFAAKSRERAADPIAGVRLIVTAGRARVFATDAYALVAMDMQSNEILAGDLPPAGVVFDVSGVALLAGLVGQGPDPVELHRQSAGGIVATWGDSMVSMPIRQGAYPSLEALMPAATAMETTVPARDLAAAVQRCESLREPGSGLSAVALSTSGHVASKANLVVSLTESEAGEGEETLPACDFVGPADIERRPKLKVRGSDLTRLLRLVEGQAILCVQTHDASGFTKGMALLRDTARPGFLGGLMPIAPSLHA